MTNYTGGMNQVMDTHQAVKELVSSGFAEGQAEAIVSLQMRFLNENVATKHDIALVQKDIQGIHKDIEVLSAQLTFRMGAIGAAIVGLLASLQVFMG